MASARLVQLIKLRFSRPPQGLFLQGGHRRALQRIAQFIQGLVVARRNAFRHEGRRALSHRLIYCDRTNPVWKRVGSILSVLASETFFTYEDAEKAQAIFEGADPEDFEEEAARRVAQVIADFKPWLGDCE